MLGGLDSRRENRDLAQLHESGARALGPSRGSPWLPAALWGCLHGVEEQRAHRAAPIHLPTGPGSRAHRDQDAVGKQILLRCHPDSIPRAARPAAGGFLGRNNPGRNPLTRAGDGHAARGAPTGHPLVGTARSLRTTAIKLLRGTQGRTAPSAPSRGDSSSPTPVAHRGTRTRTPGRLVTPQWLCGTPQPLPTFEHHPLLVEPLYPAPNRGCGPAGCVPPPSEHHHPTLGTPTRHGDTPRTTMGPPHQIRIPRSRQQRLRGQRCHGAWRPCRHGWH